MSIRDGNELLNEFLVPDKRDKRLDQLGLSGKMMGVDVTSWLMKVYHALPKEAKEKYFL